MPERKPGNGNIPLPPDTADFRQHELLLALFKSWEKARGDKMLPTKREFERTMLDYPEILPTMSMIELISKDEFRYLYVGSGRVFYLNQDESHQTVGKTFAPKARPFISGWIQSLFEQPHITFWRSRTDLPSGLEAENTNLGVVLSDDSGRHTYIVSITVFNIAYRSEVNRGEYLIGSAGISVTPIDIGCGVPDLPRDLK